MILQPPNIFENPLDVVGAYGRNDPVADWSNNRDVKIINGPYCSIRDIAHLKRHGYTCVRFFKTDGTFIEQKEIA